MSARASVTLKIATSMDARIALRDGTSQWITNGKSRARTHEFRAKHDAILVGIGTALADDPLLTARTVPLPKEQPVRIVADSQLRLSQDSRLAQSTSAGRIVLAHALSENPSRWNGRGVDLWSVGDGGGKVSPLELLRRSRAEGINSILLEGGGKLAASFLRAGLVDRIYWFRAPIIIGGDGLPAIADLGLGSMTEASQWSLQGRELIEGDCLELWEPASSAR